MDPSTEKAFARIQGGDAAVYSSFTFKENGKTAKLLYVPEGARSGFSAQKLESIVMDDKWGWCFDKGDPNCMIHCDAGAIHPKVFATNVLCKSSHFKTFWDDALMQARFNQKKEGPEAEEYALNCIVSIVTPSPMPSVSGSVTDAMCLGPRLYP